MLITSVVLNWNRRDDTLACVAALQALELRSAQQEIVVVDNGSTDDSVAALRAAHDEVEIVQLERNLGYAAGMNAGIRHALAEGADWTLLVNNDTLAMPDMLQLMLDAGTGPSVGMVAPTVYYMDQPDRVWPSAGRRRQLTLAAFDTTASPPTSEPYDVDWATGCCLLVRRALWEDVGLFDERYGFYYEDHDLCLRAAKAGWRMVHVPQAGVLHRVAASTGQGSPRQAYLLARGSVPFYLSHTRGAQRLLIVPYRFGSFLRTLLEALLEGRPQVGTAYARGLWDGLRDVRRHSGPVALDDRTASKGV
jgi:GT2 family glycosyltransferase